MYTKLASSTWISGQPTKGQQRANPENNRKCNEKKSDFTWCEIILSESEEEENLTFACFLTSNETYTFTSIVFNIYF